MPSDEVEKQQCRVYGLLKTTDFLVAENTAKGLYKKHGDQFIEPISRPMLENDWLSFLKDKQHNSPKEVSGQLWDFKGNCLVFIGDKLVGDHTAFVKWAKDEHDFTDFRPAALNEACAIEAYKEHLVSSKHDFVYMEIQANGKSLGRLVIELHSDKLPKTCENFKQLCIGGLQETKAHQPPLDLTYQGSMFHRIVKNGWIQGGDIVQGKGDGGWSIYGELFEDENYSMLHTQRGVVGMANKGRHSNSSQFYITLQPSPWMDCQYVAFGQVIEGLDILDALEEQETYNERPLQECRIKTCGQVEPASVG